VNEGVCEIVDPDEALGKASSQSASPDTKVKFVEAAALNEEDKKLARGFYARVLEYVKARDDAEADAAGKAAPAAAPAASQRGGIIEVHSVDEFYQARPAPCARGPREQRVGGSRGSTAGRPCLLLRRWPLPPFEEVALASF